MQAQRESRGIAVPLTLALDKVMVTATTQPLYFQERPSVPLHRRLGGPQG